MDVSAARVRGSLEFADAAREDMSNIVRLEHVNLRIGDAVIANVFYVLGMGFTRDPHFVVGPDNMWINVGETQFHLPNGVPQVLRGVVGVVIPDLDALAERLDFVAPRLSGTRFAWSRQTSDVLVTCPWGNRLHCFAPGAAHPGMRLGVAYVRFDVPARAAAPIARFYETVLECPCTMSEESGLARAVVAVGANQNLVFAEAESDIAPYDGHHIAVYVGNMSRAFAWLKERGRVTEGLLSHQYRFKDIVDPESGRVVYEIEHEVRSLKHPMFMRPLVNRDPILTAQSYSSGARPSPNPSWGP